MSTLEYLPKMSYNSLSQETRGYLLTSMSRNIDTKAIPDLAIYH